MQCKFLQVFSVTGYPLPFWQKNIQTGGLPNDPYVYFMLDKAQEWCFCLSWADWRHIVDYTIPIHNMTTGKFLREA